jgi:hypothetical protein
MEQSRMTCRWFLVAVVVLAACAPDAGTGRPAATGPSAGTGRSAGTTVTVARTGGFAGVDDRVVIGPGGSWSTTNRAGARRTGQLAAQQRDELERLARDPRLTAEATRIASPSTCADVYRYVVTVDPVQVSFADCPADGDAPVAAAAIVRLVAGAVWS